MRQPVLAVLPAVLFSLLTSCSEQTDQTGQTGQAAVPPQSPSAQSPEPGSDVDTAAYRRIIRDETRLVIVDFHADWCGPCKMLAPTLEKVAKDHSGDVFLIKVNVDNNRELAGEIGVQSIPYVQFYKGGKAVDEFIGVVPEERILEIVRKHSAGS